MARDLHADTVTALGSDTLRVAAFVKMEFDSADVNVWSGIGEKVLGSDTYTGLGNLGAVSAVTEDGQLNAHEVDFTLSGVPSAYLSLALAEPYKYRPISLIMSFLDATGAVISDAFTMFKGKMDVMLIQEGADTSTVSVRAESAMKEAERAGSRKFNAQSHQIDYPGDRYFRHQNLIQNQELLFGPTPGREPARKRTSSRPVRSTFR